MARLQVLVCCAALATAATAPPSLAELTGNATAGVTELLSFYNHTSGFFGTMGVPFWTTANAIETLANYMMAVPSDATRIMPYVENTFRTSKPRYCPCWMDDMQWYVLAWLQVYKATGNVTYRTEAEDIFANITGRWNAWNTTCGGVTWELHQKVPYLNSITNELFLDAATGLWQAGSTQIFANFTALGWAKAEWDWFHNGPLQVANGLITDGLQSDCKKTQGAEWTYNQGTLFSGAARASDLFDDLSIAKWAATLANTALAYYGPVIKELACAADGDCGATGQDGKQFKGVFVRHLGYARTALAAATSDPAGTLAAWNSAILNNAASLLQSGTKVPGTAGPGSVQFSQLWQGPVQTPRQDQNPWVSQGSGLDLIIAALNVQAGN